MPVDPQLYQTPCLTLSSNLNTLIQDTFPNLQQHYQQRLEIEEDIKRNARSLPAALWATLIEEPFQLLSPVVEARLADDICFDRESSLGALFTFVAWFLSSAMLFSIQVRQTADIIGLISWIAVLSGLIYTIVQLLTRQ